MRHFTYLTAITLVLATNLVACRDSSTATPQNLNAPQNSAQNPSANTLGNGIDDRGFTANTDVSKKFQEQYPLEYNCTQELCSSYFKQYPSLIKMTESAATPTEQQKKYYTDYIQPALVKYYNIRKANAQKWLDLLEAKDSEFASIKLTEDQLRVLQTLYVLNNVQKIPAASTYWNGKFSELDFQKASLAFESYGKWDFLEEMHPQTSLTNAATLELNFIERTLPRLNKLIAGVNPFDPVISDKIRRSVPLDMMEAEALSAFALQMRRLDHFLFGPGVSLITELMKSTPFTTEELYKYYSNKSFQKDLTKRTQTDLTDRCSDHYYQSINLYPQPEQIQKFKSLAEQTRTSALAQLNTQDPAFEKVKELKFIYPESAQDNSTNWYSSMQAKIRYAEQDTASLDALDTQSIYSKALILMLFSDSSDEDNLCPRLPDSRITDSTSVAFGTVVVSWYAVRYPELGVGLLAHEIGHTVGALSTMSDAAKTCVKSKQSSEQYEYEDFADLFAAKTTATLAVQSQVASGNVACAMMDTLYPLKNLNAKEPHSTLLYRAMQWQLATGGNVPSSCQKLAARDNAQATQSCK